MTGICGFVFWVIPLVAVRKQHGKRSLATFSSSRRVGDNVVGLRRQPDTRRRKVRRENFVLQLRAKQTALSVARVLLPAVIATGLGVSYFDNLSRYINENFLDPSSISFLSSDDIQFIPSFLTVISLLFSILAGNAYDSLYSQQEEIYLALYREVSDAKSLLEQLGLVCSGRPFYNDALRMLQIYIKTDLRRLDLPPAELIARSPSEDPLEAIMFLTSIGVPSVVYETVRDLRQARGYRLGAMQKKTPVLTIVLLYILAFLELAAFPLLGAGTAVGASESIFKVQGALFGGLCGASVLVLRIIQELWRTSGGAFNVDIVLAKMVSGLTEELDYRASTNTYRENLGYENTYYGSNRFPKRLLDDPDSYYYDNAVGDGKGESDRGDFGGGDGSSEPAVKQEASSGNATANGEYAAMKLRLERLEQRLAAQGNFYDDDDYDDERRRRRGPIRRFLSRIFRRRRNRRSLGDDDGPLVF